MSALLDHAGYEAPLEGWQGERNVTTRKWMMDADTPERVIEAYNECQASDPEGEVTAARLVDALTGQGSLLGAP